MTAGHCLSFSLEGAAFVAQVSWASFHPPCWWSCQNLAICAVLLPVQMRCRRPSGCWVCRKHLLSIQRSAQEPRLREFAASGMKLETSGRHRKSSPDWCLRALCRGWLHVVCGASRYHISVQRLELIHQEILLLFS